MHEFMNKINGYFFKLTFLANIYTFSYKLGTFNGYKKS